MIAAGPRRERDVASHLTRPIVFAFCQAIVWYREQQPMCAYHNYNKNAHCISSPKAE